MPTRAGILPFEPRRFRPSDGHQLVRWLLLGLCAYFAIHGVGTALKPYGSDFTIYWKAGRAVLEGRDPYDVFGFIYLPVFAVCMAPFALLPQAGAIVAWQLLSFAALVYVLRACVRLVEREGLPTPRWLEWAPLLFVLRLVDSNFANGQVNLLVFALVVLGAEAWQRRVRRDEPTGSRDAALAATERRVDRERTTAGAWIGAAAALKIVPGFFALHALLRGAWRMLLATVLTAVVAVAIVPVPFLGCRGNVNGLQRWWHETTAPYVHGGAELLEAREYLPGQSLTATTYRLLSKTPATSLGDEGPSAEIADLPLSTTRWIVRGLQAFVLATIAVTILRSRRVGAQGAWLRELASTTCGALLLAPLVHKAHMCWLVLPMTVLLCGTPIGQGRLARVARWTAIAVAFALIGLTTPTLFGRQLASTFLSHNAIFFGLVGVFVAVLVDVWSAEPQGERTSIR